MVKISDEHIIQTDAKFLLDNPDNWDVLDSIYDMVDTTAQYPFALIKKCKELTLNPTTIERNARIFRYYLSLLMAEHITIKELQKNLEQLKHDNTTQFMEYIDKVYNKRNLTFKKLIQVFDVLNHFDNHILEDISITPCKTNLVLEDNNTSLPFALIRIQDITYQCTVKDVEFLIDMLKDAIKNQ